MSRKKKNAKVRKSFSKDFKVNAVKMTMENGVFVKAIAEELDIPVQYLSNWINEYHKSKKI